MRSMEALWLLALLALERNRMMARFVDLQQTRPTAYVRTRSFTCIWRHLDSWPCFVSGFSARQFFGRTQSDMWKSIKQKWAARLGVTVRLSVQGRTRLGSLNLQMVDAASVVTLELKRSFRINVG
jgi:hypothetical protein